jgi:hypothetical protein
MEKALLITTIDDLRYSGKEYDRLYFGNEFCERLIPSPSEVREALKFTRRKGLAFSLLTPYVTDQGVLRLKLLLELLKESTAEVIINDWGVFHLLQRCSPKLTPVLGRLLTKQKRGPGLVKLLKRERKIKFIQNPDHPEEKCIVVQKKLPIDLDRYYKGCNTGSVPIIHDFLIENRVRRIELDNLAHGLDLELQNGRMSASIYWPYAYITTTLFCPSAGCDWKEKSSLKVRPCRKECRRYVFILRNRSMPKILYLKGNTQFYKNRHRQLKEWEKLGIDRIVDEPHIPL